MPVVPWPPFAHTQVAGQACCHPMLHDQTCVSTQEAPPSVRTATSDPLGTSVRHATSASVGQRRAP
eukprot:6082449-Alexandrium_andersonii.AAC.1